MPRFLALTGFRCLAATMVFVYHNRKYWRELLHPEFLRVINEFHIGVSLFFVLSGFLISWTYEDAPLQTGKGYVKYALGRMLRILPLYWLILFAYCIDPVFGNGKFSALTFTLAHGFSNQYNLNGIAQAWSLTVEMTFYMFAPLVFFLQRKHILYALGFVLILLGISYGIGEILYLNHINRANWFRPLSFLLGGTFPGRGFEFLMGMLLAVMLKKNNFMLLDKLKYKTTFGFVGIFLVAYIIGLFQPDKFHHGTDHPVGLLLHNILLPFFTTIALLGLIQERTWLQRFFSSKLLVLLGNASFAFYLIHISYVNIRIRKLFLLPDRNFVVLWLVAIALYLFFEKPIYDFGRKMLKRWR